MNGDLEERGVSGGSLGAHTQLRHEAYGSIGGLHLGGHALSELEVVRDLVRHKVTPDERNALLERGNGGNAFVSIGVQREPDEGEGSTGSSQESACNTLHSHVWHVRHHQFESGDLVEGVGETTLSCGQLIVECKLAFARSGVLRLDGWEEAG